MITYTKRCTICGKEFTTKSQRATACSDECRRIREIDRGRQKRERKRGKRSTRRDGLSLSEAARLAREHGMTYGQYMAFLNTESSRRGKWND